MDARRKGAEVADALDFVVRQLDAKMIFQAGEQLESLETIDAQLFEEIIVGGDTLKCFEVRSRISCVVCSRVRMRA